MKSFILLVFMPVFLSCNSCQTQNKKEPDYQEKMTGISFETNMHNFEKLEAGEIVVFSFVFKNSGKEDLLIKNVKTDCGCLISKFTNTPVKSGETGLVEVEFDSSGLFGKQYKTIIVEANVPEPKHLAIFAEINNEQLKIKY